MEIFDNFVSHILDQEEFFEVLGEAFAVVIFAFPLEVKAGDKIFRLHLRLLLRIVYQHDVLQIPVFQEALEVFY